MYAYANLVRLVLIQRRFFAVTVHLVMQELTKQSHINTRSPPISPSVLPHPTSRNTPRVPRNRVQRPLFLFCPSPDSCAIHHTIIPAGPLRSNQTSGRATDPDPAKRPPSPVIWKQKKVGLPKKGQRVSARLCLHHGISTVAQVN